MRGRSQVGRQKFTRLHSVVRLHSSPPNKIKYRKHLLNRWQRGQEVKAGLARPPCSGSNPLITSLCYLFSSNNHDIDAFSALTNATTAPSGVATIFRSR